MRAIKYGKKAFGAAAQSGYTLIEMAVVMIIIGVLLAPLGAAYNSYMKKQTFEITDRNISLMTTVMGAYRGLNGRYPCPASLTATRDDATYGHESDCADAVTIPIGSCMNGICVKQSARTLASAPTTPIRVRVGAVPFRQLNLSEDAAYDAYGNRLTYIVTESLAVADSFNVDNGGVGIIDSQEPGQSLLSVPNTAHFALISHGQNGAGAYSKIGTMDRPCLPVTSKEGQNCYDDSNHLAIYRQGEVSTAEGSSYFDDTLTYFVRGEITPWLVIEDQPSNIYFKDLSANSSVGIQVPATADIAERSQVNSIVRARQALEVESLCNMGGTSCTQADVITGNEVDGGGLKCPAGQFMVAISNNAPECVDEVYSNCPDGEVVTGISAGGEIECDEPPTPPVPPPPPYVPADCPTTTKSLCSTNQTVLTGPHDTVRTITAGVSRTQRYRCDDGTWKKQGGESGLCTCTPRTENRTLGCGTGFTGGNYQERTFSCPAGTWSPWTTTPDGNTCTCVGDMQTRNIPCPPEHTGNHSEQRAFTCSSTTAGAWGPWTLVENTCTCNERTVSRTLNCTGGLTGTYTQEQSFSCSTLTWSPWTTTVNNCTCVEDSQTRPRSCPLGWSGGITEGRDFECPAAAWTGWAVISNTCSCTDSTQERTLACTGGLTGTYTQERDFTCATSSWSSWATVANNCICTPKMENRTVDCPSGYEGEITESRSFQCPGGTWTGWAETSRNCTEIPPVVCNWEPNGSGADQTTRRGPRVGDQCTCGASGPCHEVVGGGLYYNYNSCSCQ
ncbi:MAG: type II secretion system protein [Micavibrio sp.]